MKKKLQVVLCVLFASFILIGLADVSEAKQTTTWNYKKTVKKTAGSFTYHAFPSKNGKEAWIYKVKMKKKASTMSIPKKIGNRKVTRIGNHKNRDALLMSDLTANLFGDLLERCHDFNGSRTTNKSIKKITIPDTVDTIEPTTFFGLASLQSIVIPAKVKELEAETFYGCKNLKTVTLPGNLKKLDVAAFEECPKIRKMKLSSKNKVYEIKGNCVIRKKDHALVYALPGKVSFRIPEGVEVIKEYAFNNCISRTVHIPASVTMIEGHAFEKPLIGQNLHIKDVTISADNRTYARDGQSIYHIADKSLCVAIADEFQAIRISEKVENLTCDYSIVNCDRINSSISKTIFPKNLKSVMVPYISELAAKKVYFTGEEPPKLLNSLPGWASLPVSCDLYVPEQSIDLYKEWYKQNECHVPDKKWHTFHSVDEI